MSKNRRTDAVTVFWSKVCATVPAAALVGTCLVLTSQPFQARDLNQIGTSTGSPAIVVPDVAVTLPAVPARIPPDPSPVAAEPGAVTLTPPAGSTVGSSTPAGLNSIGIPGRALEAYRSAASLVGVADPSCHIDWALLAAIGRVESDHARFGGNQLDSAGVAQPGIIGIPLDGSNGTARITDTDGGLWDRDTTYDRAVGPMQFIPGTWRVVGTDADGDGVKNPQDMNDAATATAIYLCSGPGDVSRPDDLHSAIMRYNPSESYVQTVTGIAETYRHGVSALPAADLPAAGTGGTGLATFNAANAAAPPVSPATAGSALGALGLTPSTPTLQPTVTPSIPAAIPPVPAVPATPPPVSTVPKPTIPPSTPPSPTVPPSSTIPPSPAVPIPCLPDPSPSPVPGTPSPAPGTVPSTPPTQVICAP